MKIKLKHDFGAVIIETEHDEPDKLVIPKINFDCPVPGLENIVKSDFERETEFVYGFYGHLMDINSTSNLDLNAAMRKLPSFTFLESVPATLSTNKLPSEVQT